MTRPDQWQDEVLAGPGGAMTDEVGVITGPLTLRTTVVAGGLVRFDVQYKDADEWYVLTGIGSRFAAGETIGAESSLNKVFWSQYDIA
ncbi:hypothetical protein ACWCYZ_41995, partial [Streptomyces virginiae]